MAEKSRTELMVERLRELQGNTPDVEASAVVSVDGLIMASSLPSGVEEDRVSAMSAAMLSLGERISGELGRGVLEQVYTHGNEGYVLLTAVGTAVVTPLLHSNPGTLLIVSLAIRLASSDLGTLV